MEDKKVAEGALQIWPDVMVYIEETVKKPKGEVPVSYIFTTVRSAVQDLSDNCQARVLCSHSIHHGTIPADVSG